MKQRNFVALLAVVLVLVLCVSVLAACDKSTDPAKTYTYNSATSVFPTNWNPHVYQTSTDSVPLDYTTMGFYGFDYNDTKDGYKLVCEMASAFPTDVTSQYVGQFGIEEGDTALAWNIPLNMDAKFDNGDPITAADYVESLKLLLNPAAANYRADSVYEGNLALVNAELYFKQGSVLDAERADKVFSDWADASANNADELTFNIAHSYIGDWVLSMYSQATVDKNGGFHKVLQIITNGK